MPASSFGSLTKEPPLSTLDATILAAEPGMNYADLLAFARTDGSTHKDAPGLISKRFLLIDSAGIIAYDYFLSLLNTHDIRSPFIRKVMYFVWAYRDERIRRFICERIADKAGKWRVSQLLNKSNSDFFEQWVQPNTAKKARSNFEFFLAETGVFDPRTKIVSLSLEDGWLQHAAVAAAQHEPNASARAQLLADPVAFLEFHGWLGLLNASSGEASGAATTIVAADPVEDNTITASPSLPGTDLRDWDRKSPSDSGRKKTTSTIDLVAKERANKSHFNLEKLLVETSKKLGLSPKYNQNIDLSFDTNDGTVLAEIKSCTDGNFHSQFRKGISQLFEYRYLYKDQVQREVGLLLLMETSPPASKKWLIDYATTLGVTVAWKDPDGGSLVTKKLNHVALGKIVTET